ncbi:hypothetical protein LXL04_001527 [Taraxacum kok-saghyz]
MEHMQRQSSFISNLPVILTTIRERKAELADKKKELLEAKLLGRDEELTNELEYEWGSLESEIDRLEHTANVMSSRLIQQGLLVAEDMKLGGGAGVTPDIDLVKAAV